MKCKRNFENLRVREWNSSYPTKKRGPPNSTAPQSHRVLTAPQMILPTLPGLALSKLINLDKLRRPTSVSVHGCWLWLMAMCWPVTCLFCDSGPGRQACRLECQAKQLTYLDLLSRSALEHSGGSTLRGFLKIKATFSFSDFTDMTQRAMIPGILMAPKPVWLLPQNMKLPSDRCYNGCCNRMLSWSALGHVHHQPSLHTTWVGSDFWHFGWFSWNVCCRWMCWHRSGDLGCGIERDWLRRFQRSSWMEWWWNMVAKEPPSHVSKRTGQNVKTSSLNAITGPGKHPKCLGSIWVVEALFFPERLQKPIIQNVNQIVRRPKCLVPKPSFFFNCFLFPIQVWTVQLVFRSPEQQHQLIWEIWGVRPNVLRRWDAQDMSGSSYKSLG